MCCYSYSDAHYFLRSVTFIVTFKDLLRISFSFNLYPFRLLNTLFLNPSPAVDVQSRK